MSKDYKNRIPAYRQARRRKGPTWGTAAAAAAGIVLLAGLGVYFFTGPEGETAVPPAETVSIPMPPPRTEPKSDPSPKAAPKDRSPAPAKTERAPAVPPQPEPRFSFYKILAEKEVVIPENEIKTMKREESQGKKPETAYLLQAGSFTSREDAEKLKARLAEIKVKAKLEKITLENTAWYRVKIGPYATLADADKVRQYLRENKIDSIVQKAVK